MLITHPYTLIFIKPIIIKRRQTLILPLKIPSLLTYYIAKLIYISKTVFK